MKAAKEAASPGFGLLRLRLGGGGAVAFDKAVGIVMDSFGVLPDVADAVGASRQAAEFPALDGFQVALTDFGGVGDGR